MNVRSNILRASTFSTAGILFGAALLPAGSAFAAASECGADAELVADGICEVTFTETPDSAWTPPAGITKIQALLVGAGGTGVGGYGGGGGDVVLVELQTTGDVTVTVGEGSLVAYDAETNDTSIWQDSILVIAEGGRSGDLDVAYNGGESGNGIYSGEDAGNGAGGPSVGDDGGAGIVISEHTDIVSVDLFAESESCFGGGGASGYAIVQAPNVLVQLGEAGCGGGTVAYPDSATFDGNFWSAPGDADDVLAVAPRSNSGSGSGGFWGDATPQQVSGADGIVVLRYDVALAETGFDSTGAISAGAALVAGGVALAVRRRRASS